MAYQDKYNFIFRPRSSQMILLTVVYLFSLYICNDQYVHNFKYSVGYVVLSIVSFRAVWYSNNAKINLFFLYLVAFSLFIGGRFWVGVFDHDLDIFQPTYFFVYNVTPKNVSELMTWVYSFLYFVTIGYVMSRRRCCVIKEVIDRKMDSKKCVSFAKIVFPLILICILIQGMNEIYYAFTYGYGVSLVDVTEKEYNKSFITVINSVVGVMMLAFTNVYAKSEYPKYLKMYILYGILVLIGGSRFAFASILLICIWLYSKEKNIGISKILIYVIAGVIVLLVIFSLSARGAGLEGFIIFDALEVFLYSTGISLMIFHASTLVHGYPWIAYIQTFIPGSTFLYSKLSDQKLHMQDLTFQGHMCYDLNPKLYADGNGLGWSSLSDLYLYSGASILVFCILALGFGLFFAFLENKADVNLKYRFVLISISQGVLMMPRGTSSPLFVGVIYSLIFMFLVKKMLVKHVDK